MLECNIHRERQVRTCIRARSRCGEDSGDRRSLMGLEYACSTGKACFVHCIALSNMLGILARSADTYELPHTQHARTQNQHRAPWMTMIPPTDLQDKVPARLQPGACAKRLRACSDNTSKQPLLPRSECVCRGARTHVSCNPAIFASPSLFNTSRNTN